MQNRRPLLACTAVALVLAQFLLPSSNFAAPGLTRKQAKSQFRTRGNLPGVLEVRDEEEPEVVAKEPVPERRVPYTLHIVSHFPSNKHLHEDSAARKAIEEKIVLSFENNEDMIRHVEVNLQVSENFHREKRAHKSRSVTSVETPDEEGEADIQVSEGSPTGARLLAPYIFRVTVSLHNGRMIVLANAEKHAQPTLNEGLDHMVEVIRKSLREEKDRDVQARKRRRANRDNGMDDSEDVFEMEAEDDAEAAALEADRDVEKIYKAVEAASD